MILDLERSSGGEFHEFQFCIVGAGAAGILLAIELLRRGRRVLLLEAGGAEIEEQSQEPYRSELSGLKHNGIHEGRFRALGGTTRKWGGQILELDEIDFEPRSWVSGSGWPFAKSTLDEYYDRALQAEGVRQSTTKDDEVWREIGLETPTDLGENLRPFFSRWCPEPSFSRLYRKTLEADENAVVYLHANACSFELSSDGATVLGINCQTPSGKVVIFRAQQYILCLGGIETSRFLLQPTPTGHCVWDRSGLLGKHFQDHIGGTCGEITEVLSPHFNQFFLNVYSRGYKYHSKFKFSPALQKQHETLNAGGTIAFSSEIDESLGHIKESAKNLLRGRLNRLRPADLARALTNFPLLLKQTYHYKVKHRAYVPKSARISLQVHCEQEPLSQSSISLSSDRDRFGLFRTKLDWRISEAEIRTIRIFTETVRDTLAQAQLASLKIDPDLYSTDGRLLSKLWDSNHHMGGARMSECPSKGVVTPDLRLHAVRNCYVCSAAVFPTSGFSNPTHTVLALAVRLADHLCGLSLDARIQAGTAASGERV